MSRLLRLPNELIARILAELDRGSLVAVKLTCSQLNDVVTNTICLQYTFHLVATGMKDGEPERAPMCPADRIQVLKSYDAAWRSTNWAEAPYVSDIPALVYPKRVVSGSIVAEVMDRDRQTLSLWQLPSPLRRVEYKHWELAFDFAIGEFMVDASQDLLVVATANFLAWQRHRVLFLSLTTGLPHPQSVGFGHLETKLAGEYPTSNRAEICGDYVAMLIFSIGNALVIWNWKTGKKAAQSVLPRAHPGEPGFNFPSFVFLDNQHVAVVAAYHAPAAGVFNAALQLQVYAFRDGQEGTISEGCNALEFSPRCDFMLPPFLEKTFASSITFLPNTAPHYAETAQEPGIFCPDRSDRLLGVNVWSARAGFQETCVIYVRAQALLRHIASLPESPTPPMARWEDWGPRNACIQHFPGPREHRVILHGTKAFILNGLGSSRLEIKGCDFDPRRVHFGSTDQEKNADALVRLRYPMREEEVPDEWSLTEVNMYDDGVLISMRSTAERPTVPPPRYGQSAVGIHAVGLLTI